MKKIFQFIFLMSATLGAYTQISNIKIGYQEFPTAIRGQASDDAGNMYYSGTFTGQLTINNQVLGNGKGVEDIFFVKTDVKGKVIYSKTFGSKSTDGTMPDGLCQANNNLYMITTSADSIDFGSHAVSPYAINPNNSNVNCIVNLDTSGKIKWVNRTTLTLIKVLYANNVVHVFGSAPFKSGVRFNDRVLFDSSGYSYFVHLMLDSTGNLINYKTISPRETNHSFQMTYLSAFSNGKICMLFTVNGAQSFQFGQKTIYLPLAANNYTVLIKTDTSYTNVSSKVLNDSSFTFSTSAGPTVGIPLTLSDQDSLYLILNTESSKPLSYDGLSIPVSSRNSMVVLDSSLKAQRVVDLGTSYVGGNNPGIPKRRVFFKSVSIIKRSLLFTGVYAGINNSTIPEENRKDTSFLILPNLVATADFNGSSKSFAAKANLDLSNSSFNWLGDHIPYQTAGVYPIFIHVIHDSLLCFSNINDNIWNPWIINGQLENVSGSMVKNADGAETVQFVEYLPDGSRIIVGQAKGRTALDSASAIFKSSMNQTDAFVARITASGEVKWYKRIETSLTLGQCRRLVIKDNKAYFLLSYSSVGNVDNYIRIGETRHNINASQSLLASVDTAGNINALNLGNVDYRYLMLYDFDFFQNGDIAVLTYPYSGQVFDFPVTFGSYVFKLNKDNGAVKGVRLLTDSYLFYPSSIEVDKSDNIYLSTVLNYSGPTPSQSTLALHNGSTYLDQLTVENNVTGQNLVGLGVLKMSWNKFIWYKRTSGLNGFGINAGLRPILAINNKLYILGTCPSLAGVSASSGLYWDKQLVVPTVDLNGTYLLRLDTSGKLEKYNMVKVFQFYAAKKKENRIFVTGLNTGPTNADTLSVGMDGLYDALAVVFDTALTAKRVLRLATPYYEIMNDMDILNDSLVSLAYRSQVEPVLKDNKSARLFNRVLVSNADVVATDYAENAFLSSLLLKSVLVLPLKLLSFSAQRNENIVSVSWKMLADNASHFILQRSDNGTAFKDIERKVAVNSPLSIAYTTRDKLDNNGLYTYRLQIVSIDGKTTYSDFVPIWYTGKTNSFYYNTTSQQLQIIRTVNQPYAYKILDANGRTLLSKYKTSGNTIISLTNRPAGLYIVQLWEDETTTSTYRFIK